MPDKILVDKVVLERILVALNNLCLFSERDKPSAMEDGIEAIAALQCYLDKYNFEK